MSAQVIDIHEELAEAKVGTFHWRLGAIMGLLTLFDGYDTFNPAYVIHYVAKPWGLQPGQAGLLISSGLVGFLIGAAVHGIVADRLGRRGTLLGGLWITSIFTLLTATSAHSFQSYCILRLLTGMGLGVLLPLATTYINELAPRRVANTFALWGVALGWALGGTLAGLAGVFATPMFGWTALYWIGSLSFLLLPFMHLMLPESPKFLALQGRVAEIREMLTRLRPERAAAYAAAEIPVGDPQSPSIRWRPAARQISPDDVCDMGVRVPQPVLHFRSLGLDPDRDDAAWRNLRGKLRLRRPDADHVVRRRARARASGRPVWRQSRPARDLVVDRRPVRYCRLSC